MSSFARATFASLALVASLALAAPASAQNQDRAADAAFQEGRALLQKGNLAEACSKLAESDRLAPSGRAVLNLADCLERRGLVATAYGKFLEAASRAVQAGRADAEKHARERAARLEPRLARVSVVVTRDAQVEGLEIRHNGIVVPPAVWNVGELADPGTTHTFEASAPGKKTWTASLTVEEGKTSRAELRWSESAGVASSSSSSSDASPAIVQTTKHDDERAEAKPSRALAYTVLGVGVAGIAVGAIGGLQVLSSKSTIDSHCNPGTRLCDSEGIDAASRGSTWSVVSPIAFGVGAAGLAAGAYLLLRAPTNEKNDKNEKGIAVIPSFAPGNAGISLSGRM